MTMCSPARASATSSLPLSMAPTAYSKGLVFDSAVYSPLSDVSPVQSGDSHVTGMQHMGVVRTFNVPYYVTNYVTDPPAITLHPQSQTVAQGSNVTFTVTANGTAPLAYQWRFASTNIAGATTSSLHADKRAARRRRQLLCRRDQLRGQRHQLHRDPDRHRPANYRYTALGSNRQPGRQCHLHRGCRWHRAPRLPMAFASTNIAGATTSSYTRTNSQPADAGSYSVVVTNSAGSITSSTATLTVIVPPAILTHPSDQAASQGADATFTVTATGTAPLTYQWRFNTSILSEATASAYTRSNVQPANTGSYSVVVSNSAGTATSSNATLSLIVPAPTLVMQSPQVLQWQGLSNLVYKVQARTNLQETNWFTVGTASAPGTSVSFTNPADAPQRFYRVIYP